MILTLKKITIMTKERIKKHQTYSIAPVALLFMVSMMVCPHFFTKEFCSLLFIGGVSVLLVCSIVAQVYLYVRYKTTQGSLGCVPFIF